MLGDAAEPLVFARVEQLVKAGLPEAASKLLRCPAVFKDAHLSYLVVMLLYFASNLIVSEDEQARDASEEDASAEVKLRDAVT